MESLGNIAKCMRPKSAMNEIKISSIVINYPGFTQNNCEEEIMEHRYLVDGRYIYVFKDDTTCCLTLVINTASKTLHDLANGHEIGYFK